MFFWTSLVAPGIRVAFTDRGAGNLAPHVGGNPDAAVRSRHALEVELGIGPDSLHFMNQTHSTVLAEAGTGTGTRTVPDADALLSLTGTDTLAVLVADCVPVVLVGSTARNEPMTAVIHAGRKGVEGNIAGRTVGAMRRRGAESISAWIGPSVCGQCYEVPEAMREEVAGTVPLTHGTTRWGTPALNLPAGVRGQLETLAVSVQDLGADGNPCTLENERLFSHRAVGQGRPAGRLAGLVWPDA
ncbi:peptidoglycan editing factor PgeF [Arthrobacter tumbae]|uniref:polyphenol oxidase family protein n=1 Tax=Arthrobacter tumbae TaxID=163874 RepID=UPI00195AF602|nr:polyphenol oxidase family protein [Arthrobacter tumbae]MBM7782866.1 YfiH family protein [Arthrobacter tumbae]